ncbi:MAG TPA: hypothetical protein VF960_13395 [Chloroflexota bacterium]
MNDRVLEVTLEGPIGGETERAVETLAREDFLGQLLRRDGRAAELALEGGNVQLDWVDGIEKALSRPDLLTETEEEAASSLRQGYRHLIWSGMGGSVQTVHALKALGYLDTPLASVHPLDSTDPVSLNRLLGEIALLEGVKLSKGKAKAEDIRRLLSRTMMVAVAMGMTSEEPITHLNWFWNLLREFSVERPEDAVQVIALEGSYLDEFARTRNLKRFPLQLEGRCYTPGRMSAPSTRVFLRPVAWSIASRALGRDAGSRFNGEALGTVLRRAQQIYGLSRQASRSERAVQTAHDPFVRLGAYIAVEGQGRKRNKLLVVLPPSWGRLAPWIEQVVEESLGKKGKGFLVFYDQDLPAVVSGRDDCIVLRICRGDEPDPVVDLGAAHGTPVFTLRVPVQNAPGLPAGLGEVAGLFAGFERLVATFGYLQGIVFAGQPAVEAYKRYARELRDGEGVISTAEDSPWQSADRALTVNYSALIETGLMSATEWESELPSWRAASPAVAIAAILRIARRKGWLGYLDLTFNGEMTGEVRSVFGGARDRLANRTLGVPAKVRTGPSDYHSTEQSETDGPPEVASLRFVCSEHEPVVAGEYDDRFLLAQAHGTWRAMKDARRWVVMVTLRNRDTAVAELSGLFEAVNAALTQVN